MSVSGPEYAELLDSLRKDLLLDASTDLLEGTVFKALEADAALAQAPDKKTLLSSLGIARGTVAFTFAASASSGAQTVPHGLPAVPEAILLQSVSASSFLASNISAVSSSTFTANAFVTANTSVTGTFNFYWVAFL